LVQEEGFVWSPETALRGASERLIPVLMTALVTGLGLLPLAIGAGEAGRGIEGPMAIVVLGGLVSCTILHLLVLPTWALRFGRARFPDCRHRPGSPVAAWWCPGGPKSFWPVARRHSPTHACRTARSKSGPCGVEWT